jgi:hypothetical protein
MCHFLRAPFVSAIAGKFRQLSGIVTIRTAVFLAGRRLAITRRVRAFLEFRHRIVSFP